MARYYDIHPANPQRRAIVQIAEVSADQHERDYAALQAAVKDGRAQATSDI